MNPLPARLARRAFAFGVLAVCLVPAARIQAADPPAKADAAPKKSYRIATSDKLRIAVFEEEGLNKIARVDANGYVNLELVNEVRVEGLTVSEAEKAIANAYYDGRFLRHPKVTINIEEYAPREVDIYGQVRNPSRYVLPIEKDLTVSGLVAKAGGFNDQAKGSEVRLTRINPADGTKQVTIVDVDSIIKGKGKGRTEDPVLEPGDSVFVPIRII